MSAKLEPTASSIGLNGPVVTAALLTIPLILIEESNFGQPWDTIGTIFNWLTWLVFLAEAVVMLRVSPNRRGWARRHLLDLAIIVLTPPFAPAAWQAGRLFRLLRLLRLVRLFALRRLLSLEGMKYAAMLAVATVVVGGAVFADIEKVDPQGHAITTWDGIWWAITTVTTVGYGDVIPHSDGGRIIGMLIMFVGIGFVALLTAFVANKFISIESETEAKEDQILTELRAIRARLDAFEAGAQPDREGEPTE